MTIYSTLVDSPVGYLRISGSQSSIHRLDFVDGKEEQLPTTHPEPLAEAVRQLETYFSGELKEFSLRLHPEGTPFQVEVWKTMLTIPFGKTMSYGEIAKAIDFPDAARAVGGASGKNPIAVFIPCHRVVGSDGKLTGFGGGIWRKEWLLDHEAKVLAGG